MTLFAPITAPIRAQGHESHDLGPGRLVGLLAETELTGIEIGVLVARRDEPAMAARIQRELANVEVS